MPDINVTPGEALLYVMQQVPNELETLLPIYLYGGKDDVNACLTQYQKLLQSNHFEVDSSLSMRQKDASRRHFETLLAFHAAKESTYTIDTHLRLMRLLSTEPKSDINMSNFALLDKLGALDTDELTQLKSCNGGIIAEFQQYLDLNCKVLYEHFPANKREKIRFLIKDYILLFILGNRQLENMPFNLYGTDWFKDDKKRGRVFKHHGNSELKSQGNGLVFSIFRPLSGSPAERSICFTSEGNDNTRPDATKAFPQLIQDNQTAVFINSISGTFLVIMRVLLTLHKEKKLVPEVYLDWQSVRSHILALVDANLYIVGGHAYFEFMAVIKQLESYDFGEASEEYEEFVLEMKPLLDKQPQHLSAARACINDVIAYNTTAIQSRRVHEALQTNPRFCHQLNP